MKEMESEKERVSEGKKETESALKRAKARVLQFFEISTLKKKSKISKQAAGATTEELEKQLSDWKLKVSLTFLGCNFLRRFQEKELIKKEKEQPLNVDTIGQEAWR